MFEKKVKMRVATAVLTFVLAVVLVLGAAFSVGALNLNPDMIKNIAQFGKDYMNDTLDEEALTEFLADHIREKGVEDPAGLAELESLLPKDASGETNYRRLVRYLKRDPSEPIMVTAQSVMDVVSRLDSIGQISEYVRTKQEEDRKAADAAMAGQIYQPTMYTVEWYLDGAATPTVVQTNEYLVADVFVTPDVTVTSGHFIEWEIDAPFFMGTDDANGDPVVTKIYGTTKGIVEEIVNITNNIAQIDSVYEATLAPDGKTLVIAVDAEKVSYTDLFNDLKANESYSSLKSDAAHILSDVLTVVMQAGVNEFAVNGNTILTVESYDLNYLFNVMKDLNFGTIVDIDGVIDLMKQEELNFDRFIDMPAYDDGDPTTDLWQFGEYTLTMNTEGLAEDEVKVVLTLSGDVTNIETAASVASDILDVSRNGDNIFVDIDLSSSNMQLILEKAYWNDKVPEDIRNRIERFETVNEYGNKEEIYVVVGDLSVADVKDIIRNTDFEAILDNYGAGKVADTEAYDKFMKLVDKILDNIPEEYDGKSIHSVYDGEGMFSFAKHVEKTAVEEKINEYLLDAELELFGIPIDSERLAEKIIDRLAFEDFDISVDLKIGDHRQVVLTDFENPDTKYYFFTTPGTVIDDLAKLEGIEATVGHELVYTIDGVEVTETPDGDANVVYESLTNYYNVNYKITFTDKNGEDKLVEFVKRYRYGNEIDEMGDMAEYTEGYTYVDGTLTGVPAGNVMPEYDITVEATFNLNYYNVTWVVEGVETVEEYAYGAMPDFGATPEKPAEILHTWTFAGWDTPVVKVTKDATYTATFEDEFRFTTLDENITEDYVFDDWSGALVLNAEPAVSGATVKETYHDLGTILHMMGDVAEPPMGLEFRLTDSNGAPTISVSLSQGDLRAIMTALGGNIDGSVISYGTGIVSGGINDGRTYMHVTILDANGNPVPVIGMSGWGYMNAPISIPYAGDGDEETETKIYYYNEATGENEYVDFGYDGENAYVYTSHFSMFVIAEETIYYNVSVEEGIANGTVAVDKNSAAKGDKVTVTLTPDSKHFEVKEVYYYDENNEKVVVPATNGVYSFTMPHGDVRVGATIDYVVYSVTFLDKDGNVIKSFTVNSGTILNDDMLPEDPEGYQTVDKVYIFDYWKPENLIGAAIEKDVTFTPVYRFEAREYYVYTDYETENGTIEVDPDASIIGETVTVTLKPDAHYVFDSIYATDDYGATINLAFNFVGKTPVAGEDYKFEYTYTFEMPAQNVTVGATFKLDTHTVIFKDWDGTQLGAAQTVEHGKGATAPANPTRPDEGNFRFEFDGWSKNYANVVEDLVIEATYLKINKETEKVHGTITVLPVEDGSVAVVGGLTEAVEGTKVTLTVTPDEHFEIKEVYYLIGNQKTVINLDSDNSYSFIMPPNNIKVGAEFERIDFLVVFVDWDGTVLKADRVGSGLAAIAPDDPTRPDDDNYTYVFAGWDVDFSNITGELIVTATYTATPIITPDDSTTTPDSETSTPDSDTSTPDSDGETTAPDSDGETTAPEDTTGEVDTSMTDPSATGTSEPSATTTDKPVIPGVTTGDDDEEGLGTGAIVLIILLIILLVLLILIVVGYLLYIKGILPAFILWLLLDKLFGRDKDEAPVEEEAAKEAPATDALFIPLGEEVPEEEDVVLHVDAVSVDNVDDLMTDKTAEHILIMSDKVGGAGKLGIINVGVLSTSFQADDTVNLDALKEKDMIDDNIGRLKVLASGRIDKPLTVEADAFSVQAIKMITLTGGKAVKLRNADDGSIEKTVFEAPAPAPVEEAPVEEAPVEAVPVEEAPVEAVPVEETPVEEAPVEEAPVEETPAEEEQKNEE